mgnify:CR=1 FL=1
MNSFDLDLPVECDDRYWDHGDPQRRFKQPEGNPSTLTAFTLLIRLNQILATILRAIVSQLLLLVALRSALSNSIP